MYIQRKRILANDDIDTAGAQVAPEASDLLFEAEDVAELVAEVTGEPVEVTAEEDAVVFAVGEDEYTVEADGDEEVLEASRKAFRGKRFVAASTRRRRSSASQSIKSGRTIRKIPSSAARRGR